MLGSSARDTATYTPLPSTPASGLCPRTVLDFVSGIEEQLLPFWAVFVHSVDLAAERCLSWGVDETVSDNAGSSTLTQSVFQDSLTSQD